MSSRVRVNKAALRQLLSSAGVTDGLISVGDQVAHSAAQAAPKDTGDGARSIHAEQVTDQDGSLVRVSWDPQHFYMSYHEVGTSRQSAHPFLRPALDHHYNI